MRYKKIILSALLLFLLASFGYAQRAELGVKAGGAGYMGDLNQNNPIKISGISYGAFAKINLDPYWALGLHFNHGKITAADSLSTNAQFRDRNLNFNTTINEVALRTDFTFFDLYSPGSKRRFSPYIFTGIGGFIFEPKGTFDGSESNLRLIKTEGQETIYKNYALSVQYGAGAKFKYSDNLTLFSEIGYRTAFTDYLDDVSGVYPATSVSIYTNPSSNPAVGVPGTQRGDFRKRDTYMFVSIGISYTFVSQKCFTF
jgi:opacity protein-like surface antigen